MRSIPALPGWLVGAALAALAAPASPAAQDLGPERWLQYGPYAWGRTVHHDSLSYSGAWYPRDVAVYYPAESQGAEAPLARDGAPYPVAFFQHAGGSDYLDYQYLFSRLASHGIIVFSMDHNAWEGAPDSWPAHVFLFMQTIDLGFGWNEDASSRFHQALDPERVALGGHSHGAASLTMREYRPVNPAAPYGIDALFLISPCLDVPMDHYPDHYRGMPPVAVVYGSRDQDACVAHGEAIAIYEPGAGLKHYTYVVGGSHLGFTDHGSLADATISRADHQRAAASSVVAFLCLHLNGDRSALPALRGEEPLLAGTPGIRRQVQESDRVVVDDFEAGGDSVRSVAIAGVPGRSFLNGFKSDTFVSFEAGVDLVRAEIQALLPASPPAPYRVLFYEDHARGADVYAEALAREHAAGLIASPVTTHNATTFTGLIGWQPWDLIVEAHQDGVSSSTQTFDAPLRDWACSGGRIISSDFRIGSPGSASTFACSQSGYDHSTNWTTMTSTGGLFTGSLAMTNPGWGIATFGLTTGAVVYATNEGATPAPGAPGVNALGQAVTATSLLAFQNRFLLGQPSLYHPTRALEVAWSSSSASFAEVLADSGSAGFDARAWPVLSFRVLQLHGDPLNPYPLSKGFHVRLIDRAGRTAALAMSSAPQGALRYPAPPGDGIEWKSVFETYRFPLSRFLGVNPSLDVSRLDRIVFAFDETPRGRLYFDDIEFCAGDEAVTGVAADPFDRASRPAGGVLARITPNPSSGATRLSCDIASPGRLEVELFDVSGRNVGVLFTGHVTAGEWSLAWKGDLPGGGRARPGVYFVRVRSGRTASVSKIVLLP